MTTMNKHLLALAAAAMCAGAWAAGPQPAPATPAGTSTYDAASKSAATTPAGQRAPAAGDESDLLERQLQAVNARADYAKAIEANGFRITAINADKPEYLEYEVVKGNRSYEVQLDFDKGVARAAKIDVTNNLWRADSTKQMLQDSSYKPAAPLVADPQARYSDRRYMKAWTDEKDRLERALPPNQTVAVYRSMLEQQGYRVTSVNQSDADRVEYEVVKGDNSYEVQIDLDPKTRLGKEVDVTSNVWEAEGTERAKSGNPAMTTQRKQ